MTRPPRWSGNGAARGAPHPFRGPTSRPTPAAVDRYRAHSCTSAASSLRISMITSGISSGSADMHRRHAEPGLARSKASRMPSVASTCVEFAGPPPETK